MCKDKPFCKYWIDDICKRAEGCLFEGRKFIFSDDNDRWMEIIELSKPQVGERLINIRGMNYDEQKYKSSSKEN